MNSTTGENKARNSYLISSRFNISKHCEIIGSDDMY